MGQYWKIAKMAFVLGAASAAGGIVMNTVYKLAKRTGEVLVDLQEEPAAEPIVEDPVVEETTAETVEPEKA